MEFGRFKLDFRSELVRKVCFILFRGEKVYLKWIREAQIYIACFVEDFRC